LERIVWKWEGEEIMDNSEKYIKMCGKAEKIQKLLKDKFDYRRQGYCTKHKCLISEGPDGVAECPVFTKMHKGTFGKALDKLWEKEDCEMKLNTWIGLPTQDQLQKMVYEKESDYNKLFKIVNWLLKPIIKIKLEPMSSMEQLWLAFCQKELYNKIWNDGKQEWVKDVKNE